MKPLIDKIEKIFALYSTRQYGIIEEGIIYSAILLTFKGNGIQSEHINSLWTKKLLKVEGCRIYSMLDDIEFKRLWENHMVLSKVYEYLVGKRHDKKEKYGVYYTPEWIVEHMVNKLVNESLNQCKEIENFKILEPACGCGVFLLYLFDALYKHYLEKTNYKSADVCRYIIQNNLHGIDIDPRAIEICMNLLIIKVFIITGQIIDLKFNLHNNDFLSESYSNKCSYDLIIGNPPYLENRGLNKYFDKDYLKEIFITAVGRFDIYGLFIERALLSLNIHGHLYFIVPGNLLTNNNFAPIRKFILKNSSILNITNLGEGIFEDVGMNMIIISLQKVTGKADNYIICKNISSSEDKRRDINNKEHKKVPQRFYENTLLNVFDIDSTEETFKLREKIYKSCDMKVFDVAEVVAGIATGNIRKKLLTKDENIPNAKKVLLGKNVHKFYHKWSGLYFIDDKSIIDKSKGEYATFMREDMIYKEKLIIRQTSDKFICSYDNDRFYILNTLYSLVIRNEYENIIDIKYILALLNSKLFHFLYSTLIREEGKLFPQLKIFHIQYSPLIIPNKIFQQNVGEIVEKIMFLNIKINAMSDDNTKKIIKHKKERDYLNHLLDEKIFQIFCLNSKDVETINKAIK
ncbi:MAG: N-6 DNA methylase [Tissierellales bacterium]